MSALQIFTASQAKNSKNIRTLKGRYKIVKEIYRAFKSFTCIYPEDYLHGLKHAVSANTKALSCRWL
jgi:predicted translin family RNA/ssDNA-binding protein